MRAWQLPVLITKNLCQCKYYYLCYCECVNIVLFYMVITFIYLTHNCNIADQRTYVMAADCTEPSKRGLDVIATLLKPTDSLILLHIADNADLRLNSSKARRRAISKDVSNSNMSLEVDAVNNELATSGGVDKRPISPLKSPQQSLDDSFVSRDATNNINDNEVENFYYEDMNRLGFYNETLFKHQPSCITITREAGSGE